MLRSFAAAGFAAICAWAGPACAQYSNGGVKIGVLSDMSAGYSDLAGKGSVEAARLAIEDFGKEIGGKPVELISADHQNKADIASTTARRWFDLEGVDAIFDMNSTLAGIAAREVAREKGKIDVNSGAGAMSSRRASSASPPAGRSSAV